MCVSTSQSRMRHHELHGTTSCLFCDSPQTPTWSLNVLFCFFVIVSGLYQCQSNLSSASSEKPECTGSRPLCSCSTPFCANRGACTEVRLQSKKTQVAWCCDSGCVCVRARILLRLLELWHHDRDRVCIGTVRKVCRPKFRELDRWRSGDGDLTDGG